jgi:hypothetical protein
VHGDRGSDEDRPDDAPPHPFAKGGDAEGQEHDDGHGDDRANQQVTHRAPSLRAELKPQLQVPCP